MKLISVMICAMTINFAFGANCNQVDVERCLDVAYEGLDQNLASYGFDPSAAGIEEPTATCRENSSNIRYNWGYIHFGGIVDFQGVTVVDPTQGCQHVSTTLRWLGNDF